MRPGVGAPRLQYATEYAHSSHVKHTDCGVAFSTDVIGDAKRSRERAISRSHIDPSLALRIVHYMKVVSTRWNPLIQLAAMPNGNRSGQCDKCQRKEVIVHGGGDPHVAWWCDDCWDEWCAQMNVEALQCVMYGARGRLSRIVGQPTIITLICIYVW